MTVEELFNGPENWKETLERFDELLHFNRISVNLPESERARFWRVLKSFAEKVYEMGVENGKKTNGM